MEFTQGHEQLGSDTPHYLTLMLGGGKGGKNKEGKMGESEREIPTKSTLVLSDDPQMD